MIEWTDRLKVGNQVIDDDHRRLVSIINSFEMALDEKNLPQCERVLKDLADYAEQHFAREETLQTAVHFPARLGHADRHVKLREQLADVTKGFKAREPGVIKTITGFLHDWLIEHVIHEDLKMRPYLEGGRTRAARPVATVDG